MALNGIKYLVCVGLITPLVTQPSISKDVHQSSLPALPVVIILRPKKHGGNISSLRFTHFSDCCEKLLLFELLINKCLKCVFDVDRQ